MAVPTIREPSAAGAAPLGVVSLAALIALTLALPVSSWLDNIGGVGRLFEREAPPGQTSYLVARLCALLALAVGTWQCVLGLALRSDIPKPPRLARLHALGGVATLTLCGAHVALLAAAFSARKGTSMLSALVPSLDDHYHRVQALGWLALALLVAATLARAIRSRRLRPWHRLVHVAMPLALLHAFAIGSDARDVALGLFYALLAASWIVALLRVARRGRRGRVARHA